MAGRNPIPAAIHALKGNPSEFSKEEINKMSSANYEPLTDFTPPAYLSEFQKKTWRELCKKFGAVKILTVMDTMALEMLIDDYAEWREHKDYLDKNGYTIMQTNVAGGEVEKADPRCALKQSAHQRCVGLLKEFGWTPASRTKTQALSVVEQDPLKGGGIGERPKK